MELGDDMLAANIFAERQASKQALRNKRLRQLSNALD